MRSLSLRPGELVVFPRAVTPPDVLEALRGEADEIICLEVRADFGAIGYFYADFHQLDDREVIAVLDRLKSIKVGRRKGPKLSELTGRFVIASAGSAHI